MRKLILASAIILTISACVTTPVPITLSCPPNLQLPTLNEQQAMELELISNDTYEILVTRELLLKQRNETMCAIIESTQL